ncbi:hypothetical protein QJQ45_006324 [Haematococcus lacustris]|nr:hypothetical protein QJQ45_006324 [Haematococcus lacustris]
MLRCLYCAAVVTHALAYAAAISTDEPVWLHSGPFDVVHSADVLDLLPGAVPSCGPGPCRLKLTLSSPARQPSSPASFSPTAQALLTTAATATVGSGDCRVLLLSGFQLPASYYHTYAHGLATWGYTVLQYDLPGAVLKPFVRDGEEVGCMPLLLDWLRDQGRDPSSALYEVVDTQNVAAVGHSRGAKLAALLLAGGVAQVRSAVLVDPVDLSRETRSAAYPSAVEALATAAAQGRPTAALLLGGGVSGWCNPSEEAWGKFWPVLGQGSWLQVVTAAGHMQFTDAKGPAGWVWDRFCGAGNTSHKAVMKLSVAASVAWLQTSFRQQQQGELGDYMVWVEQLLEQGVLAQVARKEVAGDATRAD